MVKAIVLPEPVGAISIMESAFDSATACWMELRAVIPGSDVTARVISLRFISVLNFGYAYISIIYIMYHSSRCSMTAPHR